MRRTPDENAPPVEVYKEIIDLLVSETSELGPARWVLKGIYSKAPADRPKNDLVENLSPDQRIVLSQMLRDARTSAIHDLLSVLSWYIECHGVGLTYRGAPMPVDLSGMGLHGDYVGRAEGWEWPEDKA